jgi:hypothetical protein
MAQTIKLKRTAVEGKTPTTSNLDLGELAINTYDGRIFFEKDNGTPSIQEILTTDSDVTGSLNLNGAITASSLEINGNANITGNLVLGGNITIGDESADTISLGGEISTNIIPSTDNTLSLGSSTRRFQLNGGTPVTVTGSGAPNTLTRFSGSTEVENSTITNTDTLTEIVHSNDGQIIFTVSGSNGELFTVTDSNSGNLLEVNDTSGIDVFTVSAIGDVSASGAITASGITGLTSLNVNGNISGSSFNGTGLLSGSAQLEGFVSQSGNFVANETIIATGTNSVTSSNILALDTTNNYIGINQSNPEVTLHMTGDGAQTAQIRMEQYNDSADAPDIRTRKARGTSSSPAKNNAGDFIYRQNSERYNGSAYTTVGQFAVDSTGSADRFRLTLTVSEDGNTIDAAAAQFMIDGNNGGAIKFNNSYYFPTSDGTNGQALITDGNGVLSFSDVTSYTDSDTLVYINSQGVISGSSQVTISDTDGFTSFSSSIDTSIQTEKGRIDAILLSAGADTDSFAEIVTLINSVDTANDNAFASHYTSSNNRLDSLESFTSSIDTTIKTKLDTDGVISGSSQVISLLSNQDVNLGTGDLTATDITSTNFTINDTLTAPTITGSLLRLSENGTGLRMTNVGAFDNSSGDFRIFANQDIILATNGENGTAVTIDQTTKDATFVGNIIAGNISGSSFNGTGLLSGSITEQLPSGIVSGSSQLTSSFDSRYLNVSGEGNISGSFTGSFSGDGSNITNITVDAAATVSSTFTNSSSVTVSHNFNTRNILVAVYDDQNNQIIPQNVNTSNLDQVVITLAGSQSGTVVVAKGGHILSGSAEDSNKLGGKLPSTYATTGSNSFVGNQEITGSLNVSGGITGSVSYTNLTDLPTLVSGSTQITDSSNLVSGSTQITDGSGLLSSSNEDFSTFSSSVDTRLDSQESFSSSFDTAINLDSTNVTILGDLTVQGTTTTTNTNELNVGDNIIELNYGGSATEGGLYVKDSSGGSTVSGSLLWNSTTDRWIAGISGSESTILLAGGDSVISSSAQILDSSGILSSSNEDFTTFSSSIDGRVVTLETTFSSSVDSRLDTLEGPFSTSVDSRLDNIETYTASLDITNAVITGSFTGSFVGDGSGLTGLSVEQVATVTASFSDQSTINVSHNFATRNILVSTYDSNYQQLIPQTVSLTDENTVQVILSSAHSGHVVVAKGGHVVSGSTAASNISGLGDEIQTLTSYREDVSGASFYNITHSLDESYPFVQAWNTSNNTQEQPLDIESVNANVISVSFSANFAGKIIVKK